VSASLSAQIALRHAEHHQQSRPQHGPAAGSIAAQIAMRHAGHHSHGKPHPHNAHHIHGKTVKVSAEEHHRQLVEQSEKWVAQTFYGQLLKQMHESPFKNEKFEGGRGGEAFGQMFDQKLADKMSKGSGSTLVASLVKRIERNEAGKAYRPQALGPNVAAIRSAQVTAGHH
jgi:hypothetical protein